MSYIRMGQEGSYVDIPEGSQYYLYGGGDGVGGQSYGEFASMIAEVLDEIDWPERRSADQPSTGHIKHCFEDNFDGYDELYDSTVAPPERGEIFCQCVDRRLDGVELTDELHEAVRDWAEQETVEETCDYCGETYRPYGFQLDKQVCRKKECEDRSKADTLGIPVSVIKNEDQLFEELIERGHDLEEASNLSYDYRVEMVERYD